MARKKLAVDGTYPYDSHEKWRHVRDLTLVEAAKLVGVEVAVAEVEEHECARWGTCFLWLNKGFVLLGKEPRPEKASESFALAMAEMFAVCGPERKGIKVGDQAVYLHDGLYSLIERVA
jgi:hypothetical protein